MHEALFSPTKATLLATIKAGLLSSWPLLTAANIAKYLTKMPATHKGHLYGIRQNTHSTKPSQPNYEDAILKESKTHLVYAVILDTTNKQGWGYSDLTGQFPQTSSHENRYIFVFYSWEPMLYTWNPCKARKTTRCFKFTSKHMKNLTNNKTKD